MKGLFMTNVFRFTGFSLLSTCFITPALAGPTTGARSAPTASASVAPSATQPASEALFSALKAQDTERVAKLLTEDPGLASARRDDGTSAVMMALFARDEVSFMPPQSNAMLRAILARKPALDPFEAAATGDTQRIAAEIKKDPEFVRAVHSPPLGWTALQLAAFGGQVDTIKLLLQHGADVNAIAKTKFKNTPLQIALLSRQEEVAQFLVANGADVNATQNGGFTAMHEAAQQGSVSLIQMLLKAGADINSKTDKGATPLDVAIQHDRTQNAEFLRQHGAKVGSGAAVE